MESLFMQLLEKAGSEGREEWLRSCLALGEAVNGGQQEKDMEEGMAGVPWAPLAPW